MNLLMIILIALGIWVGVAICYFAWRVMPEVPGTDPSDLAAGTDTVKTASSAQGAKRYGDEGDEGA